MDKRVIIFAIVLLFLSAIMFLGLTNTEDTWRDNIGKQIVINNDTLIIVNYSIYDGYIMSNGTPFSAKLIDELLTIKTK